MIQRTKDGRVVMVCIRGSGKLTVAELTTLQGKTPTLTIPCSSGEHDDCGGSACECGCHTK